jgi:hypothetical protein
MHGDEWRLSVARIVRATTHQIQLRQAREASKALVGNAGELCAALLEREWVGGWVGGWVCGWMGGWVCVEGGSGEGAS